MDKTDQTEAKDAQSDKDQEAQAKPDQQENAPIIVDLASI